LALLSSSEAHTIHDEAPVTQDVALLKHPSIYLRSCDITFSILRMLVPDIQLCKNQNIKKTKLFFLRLASAGFQTTIT